VAGLKDTALTMQDREQLTRAIDEKLDGKPTQGPLAQFPSLLASRATSWRVLRPSLEGCGARSTVAVV
jgi:hypothetical protein